MYISKWIMTQGAITNASRIEISMGYYKKDVTPVC